MSEARANILRRLRDTQITATAQNPTPTTTTTSSMEERIDRFTEKQHAVHGEVHLVQRDQWIDWIKSELPKRGLQRLLAGTGEIGSQLSQQQLPDIELSLYDKQIEQWKSTLFNEVDVAITNSRCAIAETGTLILWPDADEPRLMSLVPPVHIALLNIDKLHQTFDEVITTEKWFNGMPTNALLISGPSKTADIEQTLAYGIHGPKQLITLLLQ